MRVLFLTLYPDAAASPRYRVGQFLPYLRAHGVACTVRAPLTEPEWRRLTGPGRRSRPFWYHARELPRRWLQILAGRRYDVIFVQKAVMTAYVRGLAALLRHCARFLVYDIDDAVHLAPPHPLRGPWRVFEDRKQVGKVIQAADLVLAGNRWLVEEAQGLGARRVEYFPTVVDTDRFCPASRSAPDVFRIGWIGSPSTTPHLAEATEALHRYGGAEVSLIGADPRCLPWPLDTAGDSGKVVVRPWSYDTEARELQRCAVGIMPQPRDPWVRGKCALKALLYMACGLPCVATPFGAAAEIIRDGETGLFADTTDQWCEAFDRLRDQALRGVLGGAGRALVERAYSLAAAAPRLLGLLESLR